MRWISAAAASVLWVGLLSPMHASEVTYSKHVAPLLWKHCAGCHRPDQVGPFSLLTYRDAAKRAPFLAKITADRRMPPWKPVAGFGHFRDERRLSDDEIALLQAWADTGAPEGNPADLPPAPTFPEGWVLGEPDLVLKMPEEFHVPASGPDVFRCFVIPLDLAEDRVVAATEFRPGSRAAVHHSLFFLDSSGQARRLDAADPEPGYRSFGGVGFVPSGSTGGWSPGATPRFWPPGMGHIIRKGSDLVMQVHYHPTGKQEVDQSTIALYYTKPPITNIVAAFPVVSYAIDIPPGDKEYRLNASFTVPADVKAVGIAPHMHYLGREMKAVATRPDGSVERLVWIKDWDFNWQGQYVYTEMIPLPKGTRVDLEASYDNSADNPQNPAHPPQRVRFGEQTTDEMCFCWIQFTASQRKDYFDVITAAWSTGAPPNFFGGMIKSFSLPWKEK